MSKLLATIKDHKKKWRLKAMREKNDLCKVKAGILTVLIGELETKSKGTGVETVDSDVLAAIKKFVKGIDESIAAGNDLDDCLMVEKITLEAYLPKQYTKEELQNIVNLIVESIRYDGDEELTMKDMGAVIHLLQTDHNGMYDGATASKLIKELLSKK